MNIVTDLYGQKLIGFNDTEFSYAIDVYELTYIE